jgi:hypothetical protein
MLPVLGSHFRYLLRDTLASVEQFGPEWGQVRAAATSPARGGRDEP